MGVEIAAERRLLSQDEYGFVARSHYPALGDLPREELVPLARWLRERRARARDIMRGRRRVRSGKAEPRAAAAEPPGERGLSAKKQVFARALRRVNGRIERLLAEDKRARNTQKLREALERKRAAPVHLTCPRRSGPAAMRGRQGQGGAVGRLHVVLLLRRRGSGRAWTLARRRDPGQTHEI